MSDSPTVRTRELRDSIEQLWSEADSPPPLADEAHLPSLAARDHVQHHPELAYLNQHWIWETGASGSWLRTKLAGLFGRVLDRYLLDERAFVERLVRFQNELAKRCDELSEEARALATAQRALADAVDERLERLERRGNTLHGVLEARLERLEAVASRGDAPR